MISLKQEMRQKYEVHDSMTLYGKGFEDGLLEKIVNLAYASLAPYCSKCWNITAVKSPVMQQKLYNAANDRRMLECAISLIICEQGQIHENISVCEGLGKSGTHQLELLSLSIGYAAKYYCIDYFVLKTFDAEKIARELHLNRLYPVIIIGLGCFRDSRSTLLPQKIIYTGTVRIL